MKQRITVTRAVLTLALAMTAAACSDSPTAPTPTAPAASAPAAPATPAPSAPTTPTLSAIQTQIFNISCATCHNGAGPGLNLTSGSSFANLVGVPSSGSPGSVRVVAGDASNSYLVRKIEGAAGIVGARMPLNGPPYLSNAQITMIRDWITAGALNN